MRYLGLFLFTSFVWVLISAAQAARESIAAAREGRQARGISVLSGVMLGWVLAGLAFAWDNWTLLGPTLPPYGLWVIFVLHAGLGSLALISCIHAAVILRRLEPKRGDAGSTGQSGGPPGGSR